MICGWKSRTGATAAARRWRAAVLRANVFRMSVTSISARLSRLSTTGKMASRSAVRNAVCTVSICGALALGIWMPLTPAMTRSRVRRSTGSLKSIICKPFIGVTDARMSWISPSSLFRSPAGWWLTVCCSSHSCNAASLSERVASSKVISSKPSSLTIRGIYSGSSVSTKGTIYGVSFLSAVCC